MTFKEYINQENPIKNPRVVLEKKDCYQVFDSIKNSKVVVLKMFGGYYFYLMPGGSNRLYTMDPDGNKKSLSCFVFNRE